MSSTTGDSTIDQVIGFIAQTPEYRKFGANLITLSFGVTVVLTLFLQLPGLVDQAKEVWKDRKVGTVNPLTFLVFTAFFVVFLVYSFGVRSGAGMFNTIVLLPPQIPLIVGIAKFKPFRWLSLRAWIFGPRACAKRGP